MKWKVTSVNFQKLNEKFVSVDQIYTGEYFLIQYDTMEKYRNSHCEIVFVRFHSETLC